MRGIYLHREAFCLTYKLLSNINNLRPEIRFNVDIHHTHSNLLTLGLAENSKYLQTLKQKSKNGTTLAHNKGKTWKQ
jgi:zona occludens toxin (predicted ATPase)